MPASTTAAHDIAAARQAERIAFLHRVPFVLEGLSLGFLPGLREDCGYQTTQFDTLDIPVGMLEYLAEKNPRRTSGPSYASSRRDSLESTPQHPSDRGPQAVATPSAPIKLDVFPLNCVVATYNLGSDRQLNLPLPALIDRSMTITKKHSLTQVV